MSSLEEFLGRHFDELSRYARLLAGNVPDAEDLLAATLVAVSTHWVKVAAADQPLLYVRRMVTNKHLSERRSWHRRHVVPVENLPEIESYNSPSGPVDRIFIERELQKLPRNQRVAIVMRYLLDCPYSEIAAELSMSEPGARTCVHRALTTLRTSGADNQPDAAVRSVPQWV